MTTKGPTLEEMARSYFDQPGSFALRSVAYRYEGAKITDIDVWVYRRAAGIRTRCIVDIKNRRSPKAYERVSWVRGMQMALNCDQAFVATTSVSPTVAAYARKHNVGVLTKAFLTQWVKGRDSEERMTLEEFTQNMAEYRGHTLDGDWVKRIHDSKAALINPGGYRAFNKALAAFRFFAERSMTRRYQEEQVRRGMWMTAAVACIALDAAVAEIAYADERTRYATIADGVTYGDVGDSGVKSRISEVLTVIERGLENGRLVARQARDLIKGQFEMVRADVVAEHFARMSHCESLLEVARELESLAHVPHWPAAKPPSRDARVVLGVFADFVQVERRGVLDNHRTQRATGGPNPQEGNEAPSEMANAPVKETGHGPLFASQRTGGDKEIS